MKKMTTVKQMFHVKHYCFKLLFPPRYGVPVYR